MVGVGASVSLGGGAPSWVPTGLGDGVKLWLRPEELVNPNRLLQTADFENVAWTAGGTIVRTGEQTDPLGGSSAALLDNTANNGHYLYQNAVGFQAGADEVMSVWVKRGPGHNGTDECKLAINDGVGTTESAFVPEATWTRHEVTRTLDGSATRYRMLLYPNSTSAARAGTYYAFPQGESGVAASPYKANGATAGGIIASWADLSGYGNNATQATQASMSLVDADVLDGFSGALLDGVDDFFLTSLEAGTDYEVHFIIKGGSFVGNNCYLGNETNTSRFMANTSRRLEATGGVTLVGANENLSVDTPAHIGWRHDSVSGSIYLNGVDAYQGATGSLSGTNVIIGREKSNRWYVQGHIIEVVLSTSPLTSLGRTNLMSYFSSKFPSVGI